jgi:hypothetical protein
MKHCASLEVIFMPEETKPEVTLRDLMRQSNSLTNDEKMDLIMHLTRQLKQANKPSRKWSEICGIAPNLMQGEDAQEWVSRTRREATEHREQVIRGEV